MNQKKNIRSKHRAQRSALVTQMSPSILNISFSALPSALHKLLKRTSCLASYIPIGSEANPLKITEKARDIGLQICLPHISSKSSPMRFIEWQKNDILIEGPMKLQQPSVDNAICTPDIILVPLIAFDRQMNRLGQGAGHYDRALSLLENKITIGIAWSVQEEDTLPCDPWDHKLDAILTEREWVTV